MSTETEKLKLFKWDTSNEIDLESDFDIEKTLNENWDRIDDNTAEVSKKNIEQDNSISELQEEIENLRNISNIMPSVNETGENITLNNTAKNVRFRKFKVGGNVKQETRSGKNLFKTIQTSTKNGMTLTNNKDGSYTLSGTTTAATSFYVSNLNYSAGVYAISANNSVAVSNDSFYISVEHANGRVTQTFTLINMKKTAGTGVINALSIVLPSGLTLNNFIIKPQLEVVKSTSDSATEFEQYGAMPSIDYTSKIKTVGSNINIFDITKYDYRKFNEASVEITDSTNFRIIATTSKNANNAVGFKVMDLTNYAGKTLTLKAKVKSSTSTNKGFLVLRQNNADYTGTKSNEKYDETQNTTDGVIILQYKVADTINDSNRYLFAWFFATRGSDCNANDYVDYKVKIAEGTEAGEYSKYNQGCTKIVKANKNLAIKKDKVWYNSKTQLFEIVEQGNAFVAKVKENATITINKKNEGNRFIIITSENEIKVGNKYSRIIISNSNTNRKTYTFNTNEREKYVFFGYYLGEDETQKELSAEEVQIEISSTAKEYNQHEEQSYIMPVQNEMLEGDYFDWNNEEEVHGWKKIILNGTENWQLYSAGTNISRRFGLALTENVPLKETEKYGKGYSTHFEITQFTNGDLSIFLQVEPNNWYIAVTDVNSKWSSIVEFKSWLKAKYDAGTPVIIYYKTVAETRLKFTDEQKAVAKEIQKATSYEDATHIYSTDEVSPVFDVEAVADIRKLIANTSTTAEEEG